MVQSIRDAIVNRVEITGGGGGVQTVTGLNTDNSDPANPVIEISVDGVTIVGDGTPGNPLSAVTGGSGDVTGPASSVDNNFASFDGLTGKVIQDSGFAASDFATAAQGMLADTALQPGDNVSELVNDAGYLTTADLTGYVPYTGAASDVDLGVNGITANDVNISGQTASRIAGFDGSKNVISLDTTTYPSLTELSYVKGTTSAIQTQLNGKQAAGNYITALTGDGTASGPGSVAFTLATVNSNVGTFGSSTSIPTFTVNAKGLITAASGNVVIAPAGTLTGTTLAANVVSSSLTSVGTITSGTWSGLFGAVSGANLTNLTAANISAGTAGIDITGNAGTATALATGRTIAITGDLTYTSPTFNGTANVTAAGTLATVNSNVGTFTNATITVNGKGLITAASSGVGVGDVVGPASATDNAIARFDTTTGKLIQNSVVLIADTTGIISGTQGMTLTGVAGASYVQGRLVYDTDNECLTFYNNDSAVAMQLGQELWIRVRNVSGSSIPNGTAVYINGANTGLPTIAPAQSNASATTICAGLATETIANGSNGYVTCIGLVRGIDTSAFSAGATVFVSSSVAGGLTATAPTAPNYRYRVGIVGTSNATTGTIHVTPSTAALGNGTANQLFGMNTGGTAQEVKSLVAGTAGTDFAIANTTNTMTFNLPTASATNRGALSTADWSTFNGKQPQLNGTGFVKATGTTISYDNSTYLTTATAASTYVPYTGATGAVNLGSQTLTTTGVTRTGYLGVNTASVATQGLTTQLANAAHTGHVTINAVSQTGNNYEARNSGGTAYFYIGPDTLSGNSATANFINLSATMPSTTTAQTNGINLDITSAGSSSQQQNGLFMNLNAGYTGGSPTNGIQLTNSAAGTGASYGSASSLLNYRTGNSNCAFRATCSSSTSGINNGGQQLAAGSSTANYGSWASATSSLNTPPLNVGIMATALNATVNCAGMFALMGAGTPTFSNAALIADNGATTGAIAIFRDNGTDSLVIADGGTVTMNGDLKLNTAGNGLYIKTGSNATAGTATLVAGTITVNTTKVTANSIIMLTGQNNSGTSGELRVSARVASTSFTITSQSGTDTRLVGWVIFEPA